MRESPALDIIHLLQHKGAHVTYHDPHVPSFHHNSMMMETVSSLDAALHHADCVVIATDHSAYDWCWITEHASLIVDTRNACH